MQLAKDKKNARLFGVCSGLGNYLGIDPSMVRLMFIFSVLFAGIGILPYIILAIIMPNDNSQG